MNLEIAQSEFFQSFGHTGVPTFAHEYLSAAVLGKYGRRDRLLLCGGAFGSVTLPGCCISGVSCLLSAGYLLIEEGGAEPFVQAGDYACRLQRGQLP